MGLDQDAMTDEQAAAMADALTDERFNDNGWWGPHLRNPRPCVCCDAGEHHLCTKRARADDGPSLEPCPCREAIHRC